MSPAETKIAVYKPHSKSTKEYMVVIDDELEVSGPFLFPCPKPRRRASYANRESPTTRIHRGFDTVVQEMVGW